MTDLITKNSEERDKMLSAIHAAILEFEQNTKLVVTGVNFNTQVFRFHGNKTCDVNHYSFRFQLEIAE